MADGLVLGIDIGGTFTDLVALDTASRHVVSHKVLTTPADPNRAVADGIAALFARHGLDRAKVLRVVHATTLFANALVQRQGATVGLITTAGFGDTLGIGRERKYELYDLQIRMPEPLVPAERRLEVTERIAADGAVLRAVDPAEVVAEARRLLAMGCDSLAVCFLNSFVNGANEAAAAEAIAAALPSVAVTASHRVANEIREFDRFSTTVANAFIQPLAERYLRDFEAGLAGRCGIAAPVHVMLSSGGLATVAAAMRRPIRLLESGPAAGALAAAYFARLAGETELMALDLGGTTAKLCAVEGGVPLVTHAFEAAREKRFVPDSGLPIRIPTVDLIEIGAGGGSIARRDQLGLLKVGPRSAGAEPGPACYAQGGAEPTLTDANLALGLLNAARFAGGTMQLDAAAMRQAIGGLAQSLGLGAEATARGVHDLANESMAAAARVHAAERGLDPGRLALVVTGGGGPIHGGGVARRLGIQRMLCPPAAGVASAIGLCLAPARLDLVRFLGRPLAAMAAEAVEAGFAALEAEAREELRAMRLDAGAMQAERFADMRYLGQGFETLVALPPGPCTDTAGIVAAFRAHYERIFTRTIDWAEIELVNVRLVARVELVDRTAPIEVPAAGGAALGGAAERLVLLAGTPVAARVLDWDALPAGEVVHGPALVQQPGSTLVLGPGDACRIGPLGRAVVDLATEHADAGAGFDAVRTEVVWRRLIGIVDEASAALVRSAFSTVVRESDDFSVVITDPRGRLLAQGHKSIPSFFGTLPRTVEHFVAQFGEDIAPGDILITNDPWWGTGHLADVSVAMPVFHRGRIVAFAASTAHAPDIGGRSGAQRIADVYEEGFQIPTMKLAQGGVLDQSLLLILRKNVRSAEEVTGDLFGQMAALHLVRRRLEAVLEDWDLPGLEGFAAASFARTETAMRRAIAAWPRGEWRARLETDGMDGKPLELACRIATNGERVVVDYAGSSPQLAAAMNVPWCYTYAFTCYALKCLLDPDSPNNAGSQAAFDVVAPEGSVLNNVFPYSGGNRALTGHYLPALVLLALAPVEPDRVIAGTGSPIWSFLLRGADAAGRRFTLKAFFNGGMGASAALPGQDATSWPSNISGTPVEVMEQATPVRVLHKRLRQGSGGTGAQCGGDGTETAFLLLPGGPYSIGVNAERTRVPAHGLDGGGAGAVGAFLINGAARDIKDGPFALALGDVFTMRTPGGGGYGPAAGGAA